MPAAEPPILDVRDLTMRFPGVLALDRVSFPVRRGEIQALCGENGAGKSTLIKCLSGVWPYGSYEGTLSVDGQEARFSGVAAAERAGIAVIHQELALVRDMTVAENMVLGTEPCRFGLIDWNLVYRRTSELLSRIGLRLDPAAVVGDLGIGQQQLVEIAKALSTDPRILLLDEPTAALTETEVGVLLDILRDLRRRGITCLYISHRLDEVLAIADTVTVLRDGRSACTLPVEPGMTREALIRPMVGRDITDLFPRARGTPGAVLLEVSGLSVEGNEADSGLMLQEVSFAVRAGEVLGIGGLMGAGRTELLMHLFAGVGKRAAGDVRLAGVPLEQGQPAAAIARGLMLVSEDRKRFGLVLDQSVGFNLSLSSLRRLLTRGGFVDAHAEVRRAGELMTALRIKAPGLESTVRGLSGGNQQKVVLGKALMTEPRVILLDEPTRGIDVGAKQEVYGLINQLTAAGKAVVLVSSELPELMGMSDRILILSQGRVGGCFLHGEATQEALLQAAMAWA